MGIMIMMVKNGGVCIQYGAEFRFLVFVFWLELPALAYDTGDQYWEFYVYCVRFMVAIRSIR